jgi:hypothetical protein
MRNFILAIIAMSVAMMPGQAPAAEASSDTDPVRVKVVPVASIEIEPTSGMERPVLQVPSVADTPPAKVASPVGIVPYFWIALPVSEVPPHVVP